MTTVVIVREVGNRRYVTDDLSTSRSIEDAAVFTSPYDDRKCMNFLSFLNKNFGSGYTLMEVED